MSVDIVTFGCRLNIAESEAMRKRAEEAGLSDAVIVNTCAVTAEASRQARQAIRRIARERPGARRQVTGCGAQIEPDSFAAMGEVAHVIGNSEKLETETYEKLSFLGSNSGEKILVNDIMAVRETAPHMIEGMREHTRAFVQVQNGCDHRCTFCVIPFGRGNSRSAPMGAVVEQARLLVGNGVREIVLTGVDLTSWGADLPGRPALGRLVRAILKHAPELERLRLSSIDSIEVDEELMRALAEEERLMPHLHLSLQSGDDMILKRMKRRHSRAQAVAFCETARRLRPDIVFGADLIAGFPTETEAMFDRSLSLIEACGITYLHVFPFSPRPGTPAARMPQVPRALARERAARLREKGDEALRAYLQSEIGARRRVLTERGGRGRTEGFAPVRFSEPAPHGEMRDALIAGHDGRALLAA